MTAGLNMFRCFINVLLHRPGIGLWQDEHYALISRGTDGAEYIGAFVTLIDGLAGTRAALCPLSHAAILLADAHLVLEPDLNWNSAWNAL